MFGIKKKKKKNLSCKSKSRIMNILHSSLLLIHLQIIPFINSSPLIQKIKNLSSLNLSSTPKTLLSLFIPTKICFQSILIQFHFRSIPSTSSLFSSSILPFSINSIFFFFICWIQQMQIHFQFFFNCCSSSSFHLIVAFACLYVQSCEFPKKHQPQ